MPVESDWESMVGRRVRRNRKALGWTQAELGERLGMHQTSIAKLEAAARPIRVNELAALAVLFDVSPEDLLKPSADVAEVADAEQAVTVALDRVRLAVRTADAARLAFLAAEDRLQAAQMVSQRFKDDLTAARAHLAEVTRAQHPEAP